MDTNITPRSTSASTANVTPRNMNTTPKPDRLSSHPDVIARLERTMPLMALAMVPTFIAKTPGKSTAPKLGAACSLPAEIWMEILNNVSLDTLLAISDTFRRIYKRADGLPKVIAKARGDIEQDAGYDLKKIKKQCKEGDLNESQAKNAIRAVCDTHQYVRIHHNDSNAFLVLDALAKCGEVRSIKIGQEKINKWFDSINEEAARSNVDHFTGLAKQLGKLSIPQKVAQTELTLSPDSFKSMNRLFNRLSQHPEIRACISLKWGNVAALPWSDYKKILKSLDANPYITALHVRDIAPVHANRLIETINTLPKLRFLKMENCKLPDSVAFLETLSDNTAVQTLLIQGGRKEGLGSFNADLLFGNHSIGKLILESLTHDEAKKFIEILPTMSNLEKLTFEFPIGDKNVLAFVKSIKSGNNEALRKVTFSRGGIGFSGKDALYDIRKKMQINGVTPATSATQAKEAARKATKAVKKTALFIAILPVLTVLVIANAAGIINLESS